MADNVPITAGTGTDIATDDCGAGGHAQIVKLAYSADGVATPILADANGLEVQLGAAIPAGTNNIGDVDILSIAAGDNNIGNVDIASIAAGDNNIGNVDVVSCALPTGAATLAEQQSQTTALQLLDNAVAVLGTATYTEASTSGYVIGAVRRDADTTLVGTTNEIAPLQVDANGRLKVEAFSGETLPVSLTSTTVSGTVAHDSADSGNPVKVGGRAISDLAAATMVAAADRADFITDLDAAQITRPHTTIANSLSERVSNTNGNATALSTFGATASTRNVITGIVAINTSATFAYVDITDGSGGTIIASIPLPPESGAVVHFPTPLKSTANTAIYFDVSAAITTVILTFVGFKSKA